MDPKEEWEKFLRGELPPGQLPISPEGNKILRDLAKLHGLEDPSAAPIRPSMDGLAQHLRAVQMAREASEWARFVAIDAQQRALSPFTPAMSDKMLADCLGRKG